MAKQQSKWTADLTSLGSGTHKMVRSLLKELEQDGHWRGRRTGKGHIMLMHSDGRSTTLPSTPSDARNLRNCISDMNSGRGSRMLTNA
jgi:predicted RNA binding protein YcfA (HicA-like mRNA interferase family)